MLSKDKYKVVFDGDIYDESEAYSSSEPEYAFCRIKGNTAHIVSEYRVCREEVAKNLWFWYADNVARSTLGDGVSIVCRFSDSVDNNPYANYGDDDDDDDDSKKMIEESMEKMQKLAVEVGEISAHVLNLFEKEVGWPLTTVHEAYTDMDTSEIESLGFTFGLVVFRSCSQWRRSPQLFSLYMLLTRTGYNRAFAKASTISELFRKMVTSHGSDKAYYKGVEDWLLIAKQADKLFDSVYRKNWDPEDYSGEEDLGPSYWSYGDYPIHEGISSFTGACTDNLNLYRKFRDLKKACKKAKVAKVKAGG